MFSELMSEDAAQWPYEVLTEALTELGSGPGCFGDLPEWTEWFQFLLPRAIPRIQGQWEGGQLFQALATAVFVHCPDPSRPVLGASYHRDILDTLGRALLAPDIWQGRHVRPNQALCVLFNSPAYGYLLDAGEAYSAALCLVMRYLDESQIDGWMTSVLAIDDPFWRAAFVRWLSGAKLLLIDGAQPGDLPKRDGIIGWNGHWSIHGAAPFMDPQATLHPFFDRRRRAVVLDALHRQLTKRTLAAWKDDLETIRTQHPELDGVLLQYEQAVQSVVLDYALS